MSLGSALPGLGTPSGGIGGKVTTFFSPTATVTVSDRQAISGGQRRANVQTPLQV
jgi:hypothetical protein